MLQCFGRLALYIWRYPDFVDPVPVSRYEICNWQKKIVLIIDSKPGATQHGASSPFTYYSGIWQLLQLIYRRFAGAARSIVCQQVNLSFKYGIPVWRKNHSEGSFLFKHLLDAFIGHIGQVGKRCNLSSC